MNKLVLTLLQLIGLSVIAFSQTFKTGQTISSDSTFVIDTVNANYQAVPTSDWFEYSSRKGIPFDIDKDGTPDIEIVLKSYFGNFAYYETIKNIDIRPINDCQLLHAEEGSIIDTINWNHIKDKGGTLNYEYSLRTGNIFEYDHKGICSDYPNQYFAFLISNPVRSNTITGWLEVYSDLNRVTIKRYAFLIRKKPIITCNKTGPFNSTFTLNISFPQPVNGFTSSGIYVKNGSVVKFDSIGPGIYKTEIRAISDGLVTVEVPSHVAYDSYGNYNMASSSFSTIYDSARPAVEILKTEFPDDTIINGAFKVSISFNELYKDIQTWKNRSEAVYGFKASMLEVVNGRVTQFDSIASGYYTATITPSDEGSLTIDVRENVVTDLAGNWNKAARQFKIAVDLTPPELIISNLGKPYVNGNFEVTFTFSETIKDFKAGNIKVTNGDLGKLDSISPVLYKSTITPFKDGEVTVFVEGGGFRDLAGNVNVVSGKLIVIADFTRPSVTILKMDTNSAVGAIDVLFNFSEPVTGFDSADISIVDGTLFELDSISLSVYQASIIHSDKSEIMTINVAENVVADIAGNSNSESDYLVIEIPKTRGIFNIFPNPTSGEIVIDVREQKSFILQIMTINGKIVLNKKFNKYFREKIDLSSLTDGMYIITIQEDNFSPVSKIVILMK